MNLLRFLLGRRRLVLVSAVLLSLAGLASWLTMPREEDPQFPEREGLVLTAFPGADAETVERLVIEPIEERLAEVQDIKHTTSTARAGVAIVRVQLGDHVYATDDVWDKVEKALELARVDFPAGVGKPQLDDELIPQEAIVLAVTGSVDPLRLAAAAERVKKGLLSLPSVRRVKLIGDPQEQITIEYDDAVARRLGLDPRLLGQQLAGRSAILPGGIIHLGPRTANLRPQTDFASVEEIAATPVLLPSGSSVPLGELARVRRGPEEPAAERMRWRGEPAVGLGLIPRSSIDRTAFGDAVRARLAELAPSLAPLQVEEVIFQPDQVRTRLDQLGQSLLFGILIVAGVLFATMGLRMGLLVALVIPLVTYSALALYAAAGGILHQISIAALVIALGMLVDNAIVVVEAIQYRLDRGEPIRQAALDAVHELAVPLGSATGTTLAAFVPMLLAKGATGDFTRSIPVLIMLTLAISYVFAIVVTPAASELLLRPRRHSGNELAATALRRLAELAARRPGTVLAVAALLIAVASLGAGRIPVQFFPAADRNLVLVDLEMPEGTHLEKTDEVALAIEGALGEHPEVGPIAAFIGRAAPHFYYNLQSRPSSPHRAQLVAETTSLAAVEQVIEYSRQRIRRDFPQVEVVARRLEQGPSVEAPLEIRLYGTEPAALAQAVDAVFAEVRALPGSRDVRHDLSLGVPAVAFRIDDAAAARHGLSRADVALALAGRTLGTEVGQFRVGEDPVPILVRSAAGETFPAAGLATIDVARPGGAPVPLAQLARLEAEWRPAAIYHRDRERVVKVLGQLAEGATVQEQLRLLQPRLDQLQLPPGVRLELGGEAEESGAANAAILRVLPIGALLLLGFLLAEFNSFRRIGIVLMTVPLAAVGVVPGLLLSGQPFGFMALLGILALVGIVVNNAIVLLEVVEQRRAEGDSLQLALAEAVARRTRPILLTMLTTVAGLIPLAVSETSLWPPLAWTMISGLAVSTLLTLLVVPALYQVLFTPPRWWRQRRLHATTAAATALLLALLAGLPAAAQEPAPVVTLEQALALAVRRPAATAAEQRALGAEQGAEAERRATVLPTVSVFGTAIRRDRASELDTPVGRFPLNERSSEVYGVEVSQPLLDPAARFYRLPAARSEAEAAAQLVLRRRQELVVEAIEAFLRVLGIDAAARATDAFVASLSARLEETEARVAAGRSLEADALKVRLDLESAQLDRRRLDEQRQVAIRHLGRTLGFDGPAEPSFDGPYDLLRLDQTPSELLAQARQARPDLAALEARLAALELRAGAVRAERLPRLEARAGWQGSSGEPFLAESSLQGSLNLVWRPFAAGTHAPRQAALEAEAEAVRAELAELRRGVQVELESAQAEVATAEQALAVRARGVELASETLRVEVERHRAGRATTNDLLQAEATLRDQRTRRDLAQIELLRAWMLVRLAVGAPELFPGS